ncbi:MAG: hypothetical protein ACKVPX_15355 [Myxococcaceae bacterium]
MKFESRAAALGQLNELNVVMRGQRICNVPLKTSEATNNAKCQAAFARVQCVKVPVSGKR